MPRAFNPPIGVSTLNQRSPVVRTFSTKRVKVSLMLRDEEGKFRRDLDLLHSEIRGQRSEQKQCKSVETQYVLIRRERVGVPYVYCKESLICRKMD